MAAGNDAAPETAHVAPFLGRAWHVARRMFGFACYGLAGLLVVWVVLPLLRRLRTDARAVPADLAAQRVIHHVTRCFLRSMEWLGLIRVRWQGVERLREGPVLVVANHPSLIDTPVLISQMPEADFLVSSEWSRNPFLRRAVAEADYLRVDRGAAYLVREAAARLRAGRSVVIFPEGSRSPPEGLRRFRRGAAHIALASGCDLLLVSIEVTPRTLMKGQPWTHTPERTPEWRVEVGPRLRLEQLLDGSEKRHLASRRLTEILQGHFQRRWERGHS